MQQENITDALKTEWLDKLRTSRPGIKFEINALEDCKIVMLMSRIKDSWIAKEKFDYVGSVRKKLFQGKWAEFIDKNADYYTWLENTSEGKYTLSNIDQVPSDFREAILTGHNRCKAYAEFNSKKKRYEVIVAFNPDFGVVGTTFQKPITKLHLRRLLDMANYLDAYLLNNGNEIIDEKSIESQT